MDSYEYMCTVWIDEIRKCLKENGYTNIKDNEETIGEFLVGYRGRIFHIYSDLQIKETVDFYDACGGGGHYALGSLATSESTNIEWRVLKALEVAERFNGTVRNPFIVKRVK